MKKHLIILLFLTKLNYLAAMEGSSAVEALTEDSPGFRVQSALTNLPQQIEYGNWKRALENCEIIVTENQKAPEGLRANPTIFKRHLLSLARGFLENDKPLLAFQASHLFLLCALNCANSPQTAGYDFITRLALVKRNEAFKKDIEALAPILKNSIFKVGHKSRFFSIDELVEMHNRFGFVANPILHFNPQLICLHGSLAYFGRRVLNKIMAAGEIENHTAIILETWKHTKELKSQLSTKEYRTCKQSLRELNPSLCLE